MARIILRCLIGIAESRSLERLAQVDHLVYLL